MTLRHAITALVLVTLVHAPSAFSQSTPPAVLVMGTGGTIGSAGDYWTGNPTRVPIADLVRIRGLDTVASVGTEQFLNVASGDIGPSRWLELSRHINDVFKARPELAGVVVTHGTDTMEETAWFLDLTVGDVRPVIVTGSMRPSDMPGADGPANLFNAVRAAALPASRGRGTMVLMDDRLFAAREVTKTNTTRVETFQAPDHGPVALVEQEAVYYRMPSGGRSAPGFDVSQVRDLPRVDIVYSYGGADSVVIDALVAAGAKGLVVAGVGRGGTTSGQSAALRRAVANGVVVVSSTRTGSGLVPVGTRGARIGSGELNPQKARILLMLALSTTNDPERIRTIFGAQH